MRNQGALKHCLCRCAVAGLLAISWLSWFRGTCFGQTIPEPLATSDDSNSPALYEPVDPFNQPAGDAITPYYESNAEPWCWQALPAGIIWHSYMAGVKEPGFRAVFSRLDNGERIWDFTLGGRVGLLRYGTTSVNRPEGWELDLEGAAMPRLDEQRGYGLISCDYRFGFPLTFGMNGFQAKLAYYHLSSHLGDQFMVWNPGVQPIHFIRDSVVFALSQYFLDCVRIYGEVAAAFNTLHGAKPFEFQFGAEYSPLFCPPHRGAPFAAVNVYLRQEIGFRGDIVAQVGWQWRQGDSFRRWRMGVQFYDGYGEPREFFSQREQKIGLGVWYDF